MSRPKIFITRLIPAQAMDRLRASCEIVVWDDELPPPYDVLRREAADIVISDEAVSTCHAVIFEMDGKRYVRDLGSRTGTFVNGKQVKS